MRSGGLSPAACGHAAPRWHVRPPSGARPILTTHQPSGHRGRLTSDTIRRSRLGMHTERPWGPVLAIAAAASLALAGCAAATAGPTSPPTPASVATRSAEPTPPPIFLGSVPTYRGNAARTGEMPGPGPAGEPHILWSFQAGGSFATASVVDAGVVYAVSWDGAVHALALATGTERWTAKLAARVDASPLLFEGKLIVADENGTIHALSEVDGAPGWTFATDGPVSGSPAADGDRIVVATQAGSVYALDAGSGSVDWKVAAGGPVVKSVAISDGSVYVGVGVVVVAIAVADGAIQWRSTVATDGVVGTPAVSGGLVFAATGLDGRDPEARAVVALDIETGKVKWRYVSPTGKQIYTPAIAQGRAYVVGHDSEIVCLDATTGVVRWSAKEPSEIEALPVVSAGALFVASNGETMALDASTGKSRWKVFISGVPYGPTVVDGYLLVGTDLGVLYAIGGTD